MGQDFNPTEGAEDGAYCYGLFIEGCRWDSDQGCLEESQAKVLYTKMPQIWLKPLKLADIVERHTYTCPLYKTLFRFGTLSTTGHSTNFVTMIELTMQRRHDEAHWIKRGVAMVTQLNNWANKSTVASTKSALEAPKTFHLPCLREQ